MATRKERRMIAMFDDGTLDKMMDTLSAKYPEHTRPYLWMTAFKEGIGMMMAYEKESKKKAVKNAH